MNTTLAAPVVPAVEATETTSVAAMPFFSVSLFKLTVMSLCTFGGYEIYWFFKNWQLIRDREHSTIYPFWRTFFGFFFCYSCFKRIRDHGVLVELSTLLAADALTVSWILLTLAWNLPDPYSLITYLSVAPLLLVQAHANAINAAIAPNHVVNFKFSRWNWAVVIIGGAMAIISVLLSAGLIE